MKPLSIVIVGEVDHGKSSLVGRILEGTGSVHSDRIAKVKSICESRGIDYEPSFLLDAFEEEQNQGITIDTTQILFSSSVRQYRLIDAPGHREFLKNMVSGSSVADTAILLVDVKEGVREQTRRHCYLLKLLGIKSIFVVVNKMDLVNYSQTSFEDIKKVLFSHLMDLGIQAKAIVPVSAKKDINITSKSNVIDWYSGLDLLKILDQISNFRTDLPSLPLRFPVQDVYKFTDKRIISGRVESGRVQVGQTLQVWPSRTHVKLASIERWNSAQSDEAKAGESIGLTFEEQAFIERGHILTPLDAPLTVATLFRATIFWMGKRTISLGERIKIKLLTQEIECEISEVFGIVDTSTLKQSEEKRTFVNTQEVAEIAIKTFLPIAFDNFQSVNPSGRFVLVDQGRVSGGGIIIHPLLRKTDETRKVAKSRSVSPVISQFHVESIHRSLIKAVSWRLSGFFVTFSLVALFTKNYKAAAEFGLLEAISKVLLFFIHERFWSRIQFGKNGDVPAIVWFTGLPCSGKTTVASEVYKQLTGRGFRVEHLDGDVVRDFFPETGFDRKSREEHIRRIGFIAEKLASHGVIVLASFVSPYRESRNFVRGISKKFIEVYVTATLDECIKRDVKGMYAKAQQGEIKNFTGINDPYEEPLKPDLILDTEKYSVQECVHEVISKLEEVSSNKTIKKYEK